MRFPARLEDAYWFANSHCFHQPDAPITLAHIRLCISQFTALEINNHRKINIPTADPTIQFLHRLGRSACALTLSPCIILARVLFQENFERRGQYFQLDHTFFRTHRPCISTLEIGSVLDPLITKRLHVQPLDTRHPFCASRTAAERSWTLSQATSTRLAIEPTLKVKRPSNTVPSP